MFKKIMMLSVLLLTVFATSAQTQIPEPIVTINQVDIEADDGLIIKGDYYPTPNGTDTIGLLLLHQLGLDRTSWSDIAPQLQQAGFSVLVTDMRGFGETGGTFDFALSQNDVQTQFNWLISQQNVKNIIIVGASIGANMGYITCATNPECLSVVALSPGLDYGGVMPENALTNGYGMRPTYLVTSRDDQYSLESVLALGAMAQGDATIQIYSGDSHGTDIFADEEATQRLIAFYEWLIDCGFIFF
ncbi:MAG: alpha/beta fold hydrolase [Anaerolineae bacterium]|nr:alpha/beta fold hydrolase [Anaerolineae bacterium]